QVDLPNDQASYLMHIPLEKSVNVPQDIINLTLRLGETIWLENACADGEFKEDAYISKARSKSVLCLPIVYRKSQIGALYLENSLSTGVFTEQRMSVIKVLLTQAAISLENARLFDEVTGLNAGLEEKVAQRTRDLDQANVELASANKELESFSYTVSHDLKSPLRMIKGFSDILLDDYASQLDEEAQRILAKVVAGAKSMEDLINGLLDLSRMQRKEVKRTDLNLSQIADTVVANLRDTYPLRVVDIYIQPDMNINGDARMMHSVVENLINNAWKYSSKTESAEIAFSSALVDDELGRTERVFKVKDNGAGFDMSHAGKLFSTFQRLHNKSDFDGTGVGLSTVKRIVEKHGGRVWADSEVGKGASFYFTIPEQ
ncbi:ATP-binding protein, partial [Oleiphilus sp. HI0132]